MEILKTLLDFVGELAWPIVVVYALLLFRAPINAALSRIRSAAFPGGVSLDFESELESAETLARDISENPDELPEGKTRVQVRDSNKRLLELGLRPSPSGLDFSKYAEMVDRDPVVAVASLRTEIEAMVKNLAQGFEVSYEESDSPEEILKRLHKGGAIYTRQFQLGRQVIRLCNAAIHGVALGPRDARSVISVAQTLASEYEDWLSWGFPA